MRRPILIALLAVAGCGQEPSGQLESHARYVEHPKGRVYIEVRPTGAPHADYASEIPRGGRELAVVPTRYTIVSYTNVCSARCDSRVHARAGHCQRRVDVRPGRTSILVRWTPGEPCSIVVVT